MSILKARFIAGAGALTLAFAGLTACSAGGSDSGSGGTASGDGAHIELTMWHGFTGSDGPALQSVIDSFNKSQSEITIKAETYPWDSLYNKFLTSLTSKSGPDIIAMSASNLAQYAQKGALTPTTDFYDGTTYMDTKPVAEAAISASIFDGVNYGVPLNIGPVMLYWNKDLFKAAGLDPDKPPTTWQEFEEYASKLTVDNNDDGKPEQYAISIGDNNTVPVYPALFEQGGGRLVSKDGKTSELGSAKTLAAANYWVNLVKDKKITPVGMSGSDADQLFQSGKAAMELNGPWLTTGLTAAKLNYGVAMPFEGSAGPSVMTDIVSWAIPKGTSDQNRQAAYKFFAYWLSAQGQTMWANGSGFPPVRSDIPEADLTNPYTKIFGAKDVLDAMTVFMPGVPANQEINNDIFTPALQKALAGDGTVDDLFRQASKQIQEKLDQAK